MKNQPIFHSMIGQRNMHKIDSQENYASHTTGKTEQYQTGLMVALSNFACIFFPGLRILFLRSTVFPCSSVKCQL